LKIFFRALRTLPICPSRAFVMSLFLVASLFLSEQVSAAVPAFPGAEGGGMYTRGGRGGDIYIVTTLEDGGPGSLREAVESYGPRTVVFEVSGTIRLTKDLDIRYPDITIAGQTAPGDGITLADHWMEIKAPNVIVRFLRFRLGDQSGVQDDAVGGRYLKNVILDHCSASWSIDEAMSFYGNDSMTVQWCIISESLYMSNHEKGAHGYGGIWGGSNTSFHHNLLAHHTSRNPRFAGGETSTCINTDFRNNVIYNWGFNSAYGGEDGRINMVANYFKPGPATKSSVSSRIVEPSNSNGRWFIADNVMHGNATVTADNWQGGVQGSSANPNVIKVDEPFPYLPVQTDPAALAFERVMEHAGASVPRRDTVDARIIRETREGSATFEGRWYEIRQNLDPGPVRGIIDSVHEVGGWPELKSTTPAPDRDRDGMPDDWELARGLDPDNIEDRNDLHPSGYTMLELYLHSLVPYWNVVSIDDLATLPERHIPVGSYPNPFNGQSTLYFDLPLDGPASVRIFSLTGQLVADLGRRDGRRGRQEILWTAAADDGRELPSGLYLLEVSQDDRRGLHKIQLLK